MQTTNKRSGRYLRSADTSFSCCIMYGKITDILQQEGEVCWLLYCFF